MSHKKEWGQFVRQAANKKFPSNLSSYYANSKVELFNFWLNSSKNWDACQLLVKRSTENKNSNLRGWEAVQGKTLRDRYSQDKFDRIVKARQDAGLFYEDEDFPGDVDETWLLYLVFLFKFSAGSKSVGLKT